MRCPAVGRELILEGGDIGAEDEVGIGDNPLDRGLHLHRDGGVLGLQINER
jgi:hypothetical protein